MDGVWVWLIASLCAALGTLMLLFPRALPRIEEFLNRDWGSRELFALRLGLAFERRLEERLNAPVLTGSVVWDSALRRRPRTTGLSLCALAVIMVVIGGL